ncbi:MAG: alpha/beta hydrolase [Bryobacterales bacterium]
MSRRFVFLVALGVAACLAASAADLRAGKNAVELRGKKLAVYALPAVGRAEAPAVLFLPGDRGWAGKAVDMGNQMASWGFDVFAVDTNDYLSAFTGRTTLTEAQIAADLLALSNRLAPGRPVLLTGWSEGAGLVALAASSSERGSKYAGVVVFGLGNRNFLAWRWKDNFTSAVGAEPDEPTFAVKPHLAAIAPLPIAMLHSTQDQFVSAAEARALYEAAREPRKLIEVEAQNHRFDGNDEGFYRELRGAIEWAIQQRR